MSNESDTSYIPESYRAKFEAVDIEVRELHFTLAYYDQLFGSESKREILNQTAPQIFHQIQRSMLFDILMRLSRLSDPIKSAGNENLSLENLADDVTESELKATLLKTQEKLTEHLKNLKRLRNKYLSHNDLKHKLGKAEKISGISYSDIQKAAKELAECFNGFHQSLGGTTVMYDRSITQDDGDTLHHFLHYGLISREEDEPEEYLRKSLLMRDRHQPES